jgi:hypothetical protein
MSVNARLTFERLIGGLYHSIWNENVKVSKERCSRELNRLYSQLSDKVKKAAEQYNSLEEYQADLANIKQLYAESKEVMF